jgi:glycosyltransferase involved in cell wall biosynthesis
MKIFQVLPRRMRFDVSGASSVELCVADWVSGSRFRASTTVIAETGNEPLIPIDIKRFTPAKHLSSWRGALFIRGAAKQSGCDLIVTQQHVPTAARIAAFNPRIPVILQTHNFIAPPQGASNSWANAQTRRQFSRLAGMTFVSQATLADFKANWPDVAMPAAVINNGFDFSKWHPSEVREPVVLVVGRTQEDKGILEAAVGASQFLRTNPGWKAVFILSEANRNPGYFSAIKSVLAQSGEQASLLTGVRFSVVKELTERAAIVVVASKWREPFGRTALEAHAGGAALISSGTGGLREISGEHALYLDEVSGAGVASALEKLAGDEPLRRSLALGAAKRVKQLFSLTPEDIGAEGASSICSRLDDFYEQVTRSWTRYSRSKTA